MKTTKQNTLLLPGSLKYIFINEKSPAFDLEKGFN